MPTQDSTPTKHPTITDQAGHGEHAPNQSSESGRSSASDRSNEGGKSNELDRWLRELRQRVTQNPDYSIEDFFQEYPSSIRESITAVNLVYEHHCLRREAGMQDDPSLLLNRYPQWRSKLQLVLECDELLQEPAETIAFPEIGEMYHEFRVHSELGRGANGRVYLATQSALSDRRVALKISSCRGDEHRSLARLQHSAIVPLLLVQDDEASGTRCLCMPYLGGCTLDKAMADMASMAVEQRHGRDFVHSISSHNDSAIRLDDPNDMDRPGLRYLADVEYSQAVCWIVACLADGLHYAHQRGLLHLDLKPANVLIANDGQPMLLDFHLARDRSELVTESLDNLGGTPGYMAPEHLEAMQQIRRNARSKTNERSMVRVDQRSDIYSLGLILHDLLRGASCPWVDSQPESPRRDMAIDQRLTDVQPKSVRPILKRCLAFDPDLRYHDASTLAVDLRKIALGAERPAPHRGFALGIALGAMLASAGWFVWGNVSRPQISPPQVAPDAPVIRLGDELHNLITQVRSTDILATGSDDERRKLLELCERMWSKRLALQAAVDRVPSKAAASRMRNDLQDLGAVYRELVLRLADPSEQDSATILAEQIESELKALGKP